MNRYWLTVGLVLVGLGMSMQVTVALIQGYNYIQTRCK